MKITKLYMFVSIVLIILICKAECQYFNLNPHSVTVTEGSNVTFTCGSQYLTSCAYYKFSWQRKTDQHSDIEQISSCSDVASSFTGNSSIVERYNGRYRLQINNVQRDDAGTYWCKMIEVDGRHRNSGEALLTVNPLLAEHKPSCDFEPEQPRVGSTISFKCTLSGRDPPGPLTWFESTSSGPTQIEDITEVNPGETYAVERELTESDNMIEFTCVAGPHPLGPSCSITPLQIPPTVSISPSHLTIHEHENATFSCFFKSTPQQIADEYKWRVFLVDKDVMKVNPDTVKSLDGQFELGLHGQTLQIIDVTVDKFNNSQIRCIAFQNSTSFSSVNDSLLIVLPLTTATPRTKTVSLKETGTDKSAFNNDDNAPQGSGVIVIVGGVFGAIFFLIIIALLGCYLIKYKHNPTGLGQTAATREKRPPTAETATVSSENQNGQTYDEIPLGVPGVQNTSMSSSTTKQAEVLYACADKTGRHEIKRYSVRASRTTGQDGSTVTSGDSADEEIGNAGDHAIYTMPNKPTKTEPNHTAKNDPRKVSLPLDDNGKESDTPIEDDFGSHKTNVEGLVYADLDLQRPSSARNTTTLQSEEQSEYAEIRRDK